jgi:16S rRNA (adenine1518-N6/adenine1519-N6)-dimethyltransferase
MTDEAKYLSLKQIVEKHDIRLKKRLGQNLLLDLNLNDQIVSAARLGPDDDVVEVGAGLGSLTARMAAKARRVLAVEIDPSFEPVLKERFAETDNVHVIINDMLVLSLDEIVAEHLPGSKNLTLTGNLPFNCAVHIIMQCMEAKTFFRQQIVMTQKEVADRLIARPNTREYASITLATRFYADAEITQIVPRTVFAPRPRVDAAVVRFTCRKEEPLAGAEKEMYFKAIHAAFGTRRKMLKNALASLERQDLPPGAVMEALTAANIDHKRRGETLDLNEFVTLAKALNSQAAK